MKALGAGTDLFPMLSGTEFDKDKKGNYTGIVHAYTFSFIAMELMVPQHSFEEQVNSLTYVINDLNRFGITSIVDAATMVKSSLITFAATKTAAHR